MCYQVPALPATVPGSLRTGGVPHGPSPRSTSHKGHFTGPQGDSLEQQGCWQLIQDASSQRQQRAVPRPKANDPYRPAEQCDRTPLPQGLAAAARHRDVPAPAVCTRQGAGPTSQAFSQGLRQGTWLQKAPLLRWVKARGVGVEEPGTGAWLAQWKCCVLVMGPTASTE